MTYALDELHAPYATAVTFAHHHSNIGRVLFDDDLDQSWRAWAQRPEADDALAEVVS